MLCYFSDDLCARQTPRIWARSACLPVLHEAQMMLDGDWRLAAFPAMQLWSNAYDSATCYVVSILFQYTSIPRFPQKKQQQQKTVSSIFRKTVVHVILWHGVDPPTRDTVYLYSVQHPEPSRDTRIWQNRESEDFSFGGKDITIEMPLILFQTVHATVDKLCQIKIKHNFHNIRFWYSAKASRLNAF